MFNDISGHMYMWVLWIVIPLIYELFGSVISCVALVIKKIFSKQQILNYHPIVTIIVPVYNSEKTLKSCLISIINQTYPLSHIEVMVVDNGEYSELSYKIFEKVQQDYPDLNIKFYYSEKGKSQALNQGVFMSQGKYIINIDSDGWLDTEAIYKIVLRFENNSNVSGITGSVLIDSSLITGNIISSTACKCEYFEYIDAFLVGRNFKSITDNIYTVAGAFSAFKRESLFKTQLYNGDTLGEDTHMTFQIRKFDGGKIELCEDAFFFVDPIENFGKLYSQRQRWQRSEIEVAKLFQEFYPKRLSKGIFSSFFRTIVADHSMAILKSLWIVASIYYFVSIGDYYNLIGFNILLYLVYLMITLIHFASSLLFINTQKHLLKFSLKNFHCMVFMPLYRFVLYWIRVAGIINSINSEGKWKALTLYEEIKIFQEAFSGNFKKIFRNAFEFIRTFS